VSSSRVKPVLGRTRRGRSRPTGASRPTSIPPPLCADGTRRTTCQFDTI